MDEPLFQPRAFNSRYVFIPMLAVIALIVVVFFITEGRRDFVTRLSLQIQTSQERITKLGDVIYACADAESAQRGFLLTDQIKYLGPFSAAKSEAYTVLDRLIAEAGPDNPETRRELLEIRAYMDNKFVEMQSSIDMAATNLGNERAIAMMKTDVGLAWMRGLRNRVMSMQARERNNISDDIAYWNRQLTVNRYMSVGGSVLSLFLVILAGALISREIARRHGYTAELAREVDQRTRELSALSQHLQQVREIEKADLARELHDELGGLLVAIKMDLTQIAKRLDTTRPEVGERLQRIQMALASGIELKRRVIEELRPTLLDNMGLFEALRWHAGQVCDQAGIALKLQFPEIDPAIPDAAAIAVFRVVQESLTNIAKHASARNVSIEASENDGVCQLTIEDDGVGLPANHMSRSGVHGLTGMKYRMLSIGGSFDIGSAGARGVRTTLTFPVS
jgi:signal transduction histidine kinase